MNPILNQVGAIFIPVKDIEAARDWYCGLLGLPADGEVVHGHLYILPMTGTGLVLDSRIYTEDHIIKTPLFHLNTNDIEQSYAYLKNKNVELTTEIMHGHWFNFKDPDGNHIMVCKC